MTRQRGAGERGDPPGGDDVAEVGDVVAVQVGQQQRGDVGGADADGRGPHQHAAPAVDEEQSDSPARTSVEGLPGWRSTIGTAGAQQRDFDHGHRYTRPGAVPRRAIGSFVDPCSRPIRGLPIPRTGRGTVARHGVARGVERLELFVGERHDNEPRFSSTRAARRVPGIGTDATPSVVGAVAQPRQGDLCRRWPPCRSAMSRIDVDHGEIRVEGTVGEAGQVRAGSPMSRGEVGGGRTVPVRNPRPSGEYGTKPTPSSTAAGTTLASTSRLQIDHSLCTAAMGMHRDRGAQFVGRHLGQARDGGPCPRRPARPSPRRSPRSAPCTSRRCM